MKKRIISLILALLMILTLLPVTAFAEDETQTVTPAPAQEQTDIPTDPADPETPEQPEQPAEPEPPAQPEEPIQEETAENLDALDDLEVPETDEGLSVQYFNPQIDELREEDGFKLVKTYSQLSQCLLYGYNARLTANVNSDTEETNRYKMLTVRPLNGSTEITLDLNGYSITYKGVEAQECLFDLRNNDTPFTFRVVDSKGSGKVYCTNAPNAFGNVHTMFYMQLGNKLRIEGGEFVQRSNSNSATIIQVAEPNGSAAAAATSSADITITGGKFQNSSNAKLIYTCENQTGRIVNVALCGGEFMYCAKTRYNTNTTYPIAPMLLKNTKLFTAGVTMTAVDPASDRLHCYLDVYNDACKTLTLCGTHPALFNYRDTSYVPAAVGSKLAKTTAIGSSKNSYVEYVHPLITCPTLHITDIDRKEGWAKVFFEDNLKNDAGDFNLAALKCPGRANRGDTITLKLEGLPDGTDPSNVTWECHIDKTVEKLGSGLTKDYTLNKTGTYFFWAYVNKGQVDQEMKDLFRVIVKESQTVIDTVDIQLNRPVDTKDISENTLPAYSLSSGISELTSSTNWYKSPDSTAYQKQIVLVANSGSSFANNVTVTCSEGVRIVGTPSATTNGGYSYLTFTIEVTPKKVLTEIVGIVTGLTDRNPLSRFKITSQKADINSPRFYTVGERGNLQPATGEIDNNATYCIFVSVTPKEGYVIRGECTVVLKKAELSDHGGLGKRVKIAELTRYDRTTEDHLNLGAGLIGRYYGLISLTTNTPQNLGDLNWDGSVNVSDVQALYGYLTSGKPPAAGRSGCDLNGDGSVDVYDLQYLYELVIGLI